MSALFSAHGEFTIHQDGKILVNTVRGPWNIELVKEFSRAIDAPSRELHELGSWGGICIISESMLSSPDCLAMIRKIMCYGIPKFKMLAQAYVATRKVTGRGVIETSYERVFDGLCPFRFFDDYASAKEWLLARIDEADKLSD